MRIIEIRSFYVAAASFPYHQDKNSGIRVCMKMELAMWFLTLSIKTVKVIAGCDSLHKWNKIFSFQIVWLQVEIVYFWFTFDSTRVLYINLVG